MPTSDPTAKDIVLRPVDGATSHRFIRRTHYSGGSGVNVQLHIGVFIGGKLEGVMQFGPSLDKRKTRLLVSDTGWNEFIELNRMAFSDRLPRNSESRALSIAMKLIRKHAPHIKWVISFADGAQCGDGTIYRASGFVLTAITPSDNLLRLPDGSTIHKMTLESTPTHDRPELGGRSYYDLTEGKYDLQRYIEETGAVRIPGFQLRYVYFIDPSCRERLTVPILPFSEIERRGAGMYRGQPRAGTIDSDGSTFHVVQGGATPTPALHETAAD